MNANRTLFLTAQILMGLAIAIAGPTTGNSQTAPETASAAAAAPSQTGVVKLPEFGVTGAPVDPYNSSEASSAARTASNILDTPITAYVITSAFLQDINPNSLFEVENYFPGVSPSRAPSENDRATFRGFENFSRTVDNFSETLIPFMYAPYVNFDTVYLEHVELVMGPDSILSPTGTPGGTVAAVTKSPEFVRGTDISATVGNLSANKFSVDTTGPIGDGKHMAYRVIASYQDAQSYQPGSTVVDALAAMFTYKFTDTAKFTFKYFGTRTLLTGNTAMDAGNGEEVYTPDTVGGVTISNTPQPGFTFNGYDGDPTWAHYTARENAVETELTSALSERINMRLGAEIYYTDSALWPRGQPSPVLTETWNQTTGVETAVTPINPANLPEVATASRQASRQVQLQNDFAGKFEVGGLSLQPVAGWAYQRGTMPRDYSLTDKNLPADNLYAGPYDPPQPSGTSYTGGSNTPEIAWTMQMYAYLRASFLNDHLFLTGGAARTWAGVNEYSIAYVDQDGFVYGNPNAPVVDSKFSHTNNALAPSVRPWHDAYIAGVLYKLLPNVSAYYSFSTNATLASNIPLWQAGKQNEFGIKSNFFNGRLSITADHFEISQSNISSANPLYNIGQSTIPTLYTNEANHGEELSIQGGITQDLSVVMSYTNMTLRDPQGRRLRNIPDNMANALLNYHFRSGVLKNSSVFVGVIHQGNVAGETVGGFTSLGVPELPGFYLPAYNVVNAGASYRLKNYRFNLDVTNALNDHFWWAAQSRATVESYPGATVRFSVNVHFL